VAAATAAWFNNAVFPVTLVLTDLASLLHWNAVAHSAGAGTLLSCRNENRVALFLGFGHSLANCSLANSLFSCWNQNGVRFFLRLNNVLANGSLASSFFSRWDHNRVRFFLLLRLGLADGSLASSLFGHWNHHCVRLFLWLSHGLADHSLANFLFRDWYVDSDSSLFCHHLWNENGLLNRFPCAAGCAAAGIAARRTTCAGATRAAASGTRCGATFADLFAEATASLGGRRQGDSDRQRKNETHAL